MDLFFKATEYETLQASWLKVQQNGGAAGGDGVTIATFAQGATASLRDLALALRAGGWQQGPCRRVDIPKRKGGTRRLMIPPIADRIIHGTA
ncbi:hypothetical protein [Rhodobacter capsulatus]|jgi:retron-type reverse transcriptase|uniref:Conserved domain protein n=1 Tax=Rhodobacter capsulatus (strain ATCC BAA-309 / NBRC 16581 / SB1003) TaxID=272942 RepID=D5AUV9_RHOCB|nr:hypothetical protein [Rhodobacter capsulatus]ADE85748.1 conserved domain protein [Rhodobacter capsulatus SB 1003]ETD01876.1 hypothetical protein U714_11355 [Rhodobacter capsulatus DE442]ETD76933.1 hypothetical protein U717_11510 [Rhodobacter capsulatus R121]ETE53769.1 hypothetical protein U715_11515 [Rhodobacter capsulatus Y262]MDS0927480.1 hypothetical protein [Rhodobacter capsulatus]